VEVTCIKLSVVLHRLESLEMAIMIVTIFVLPLWWILCFVLVLIKLVCIGRVWGMFALVVALVVGLGK
jgi:hypothetical protein